MKLNLRIALVFTAALALFHTSCALTPEQKIQLAREAEAAAVGGFSTGTWAGAVTGATGQFVRDHTPKTAAKNPPAVPVAP